MHMAIASAFIGSSASRVLIAVIVALSVALFVVAAAILLGKSQAKVERQLAGYELPDVGGDSGGGVGMMAESETAMVQQGIAFTSRIAERTGLMAKTEAMLEQADLPIRAAELLFYAPAFGLIMFLLFAVLMGPIAGLVAGAVVVFAPFMYLDHRQRGRRKRFERQLPDTLTLLASSLRAGFSLMQGLEAVAQEISDPMRKELQRVFTEVRLGRVVEDALGDSAVRMESRDLEWTVMAIKIQREVGGNLAVLLDTVANTMVQRERVRRELQALTAEGRLSAYVLAAISPLLFLVIYLVQPSYLEPLWTEAIGIAGIIGAIALEIVGWFWLRRIVDIEV
jgi:tight adherence protein B